MFHPIHRVASFDGPGRLACLEQAPVGRELGLMQLGPRLYQAPLAVGRSPEISSTGSMSKTATES